jgi:EAL domain-containing protein (putative c-di-GMP-specific phosphodiesterase class I)
VTSRTWYLEGFIGDSKALRRFAVVDSPFRVGRQDGLQLTLDTAGVSRNHAEVLIIGNGLKLRDLGSTNGTYINRKRIQGEQTLAEGDIVHFADQEFRLILQASSDRQDLNQTRAGIGGLSEKLPQGAREFQQLLLNANVMAVFQPIVDRKRQIVAYEMLGRGAHEGLPVSPGELFKLAESLELEVHLSELFRRKAMETAAELNPDATYFFNIHPREAENLDKLLAGMEKMRKGFPQLKLVLEVHEAAVTEAAMIRQIRETLNRLDIGLAYDDFGAGQARLVEITEVPPDYVKIDMALIRDIDKAADAKRQMIKMFQSFLNQLGIKVLAEGVASEGEAHTLMSLDIDLFQGFYFGRPSPTL